MIMVTFLMLFLNSIEYLLYGLIILIFLILIAFYLRNQRKVLNYINENSVKIANGDKPEPLVIKASHFKDLNTNLLTIYENQQKATEFIKSIGENDSNIDFKPSSKNDKLGIALIEMQQKLQNFAIEEQKRNWSISGLAMFSDILRDLNQDLETLGDNILKRLLKHIDANQGKLYVVFQDENGLEYLGPISCYAWDRKKFTEEKIDKGIGLIGQCWHEAQPIYLTDIPQNYIQITSGLGAANPTNILITPLKVFDTVYGVLEIASFKTIEPFEREFIQSLSENIAGSISFVKMAEKTQFLLKEQEIELKKNEREMQNTVEKLEMAQAEMKEHEIELQRQFKQALAERKKNEAILEGCVDGVVSFNDKGIIHFTNKATEDIFGYSKSEIKNVKSLLNISFSKTKNNETTLITNTGTPIGIRTETEVNDKSGDSVTVLLTLTQVNIEDSMIYTLFIQKISADLF